MCSELKTFETVLWINGHDHLGSHPCLTFYMSYFFVCIRAMVFLYRDVFETSTSASLHNVCFCYCCENTLKIVYVFSQSRNRASMDNATTFVHSVKEKIWKYLLLSFSSRWEWRMCWFTVTWKYAYHPNILFEGAENLTVSIAHLCMCDWIFCYVGLTPINLTYAIAMKIYENRTLVFTQLCIW